MPRDIIVVGASTGGIEAIQTILKGLSTDFRSSIFIVLHMAADSPGILGRIFQRSTDLRVVTVQNREPIAPGEVYVVRPDHHLLIEPGVALASQGPKENRFRPAVDPLFRSAAVAYRQRVIGVVLSGGLYDGSAGLAAIKTLGGLAVVQDPEEALSNSMPLSAIAAVKVDHIAPASAMPSLLTHLSGQPAVEEAAMPVSAETMAEVRIARGEDPIEAGVLRLGERSEFTCPECHGVLLRLKRAGVPGFRCHTGHAYSLEALKSDLESGIQSALWTALRAVQEYEMLSAHLEKHGLEANDADAIAGAQAARVEARRREALLRSALNLRQEKGSD